LLRQRKVHPMQMLAFCYPVLAVSIIYCTWLSYRRVQFRRGRVLRDRVTFMLWTMANQIPHGRQPSARPATNAAVDCGVLAAAQRGRWEGTRQADERGWKEHSKHRGMLLPGDYLSSDSALGRDGKSQPDTRRSGLNPAKNPAKPARQRTPRT
jgi:hypothetical protein